MKQKILQKFSNVKNLPEALLNSSKNKNRKLFVGGFVAFAIVFTCCFLYQPARDFYISVREQDKLNAQYEAIKNTNEALAQDIEYLQTEDGVRQRASETLGLIQQGESIGYVSGADIVDGRDNSASSTSSKLAYKNIKTPQT